LAARVKAQVSVYPSNVGFRCSHSGRTLSQEARRRKRQGRLGEAGSFWRQHFVGEIKSPRHKSAAVATSSSSAGRTAKKGTRRSVSTASRTAIPSILISASQARRGHGVVASVSDRRSAVPARVNSDRRYSRLKPAYQIPARPARLKSSQGKQPARRLGGGRGNWERVSRPALRRKAEWRI